MRMSRPIDFGVCHDGDQVFSLFTWVPGEDARDAIPLLDSEEQYRLGVQAGQYLCKMHRIPAESGFDTWAVYYNSKMDRYIKIMRARHPARRCGEHHSLYGGAPIFA